MTNLTTHSNLKADLSLPKELTSLRQNINRLSSLGSYGAANIYNGLIRVWIHFKGEQKAKEMLFSPLLDLEEIHKLNKELEALVKSSLSDKDVTPQKELAL